MNIYKKDARTTKVDKLVLVCIRHKLRSDRPEWRLPNTHLLWSAIVAEDGVNKPSEETKRLVFVKLRQLEMSAISEEEHSK